MTPIAERFWSKVDKNGPVPAHAPELGPCWLWTAAAFSSGGYGMFQLRGKPRRAHRIAYELEVGPIPEGAELLHRCDVPLCVRPTHVRPGSRGENAADMVAKGRQATGDRHSSRTHPERIPRGDRHGSRTHPERVLRGELHGRARLRVEDVRTIRRAGAAGESGATQARQYGVADGTIRAIIARRNWAWLPDDDVRGDEVGIRLPDDEDRQA